MNYWLNRNLNFNLTPFVTDEKLKAKCTMISKTTNIVGLQGLTYLAQLLLPEANYVKVIACLILSVC